MAMMRIKKREKKGRRRRKTRRKTLPRKRTKEGTPRDTRWVTV